MGYVEGLNDARTKLADFFSILQELDMIAIIDYGMGNLRSVSKAFEAVGHQAVVTRDPRVIGNASHVVLPGVGAFGDCMDVILSGVAGRDPLFRAEDHLEFLRTEMRNRLRGSAQINLVVKLLADSERKIQRSQYGFLCWCP